MGDLDTSDAATGLPPLTELEDDPQILAITVEVTPGLALAPHQPEPIPVRWLHIRGLVRRRAHLHPGVEWGQVHIAVPVDDAVDVATALASGGLFREG